MPNISPYTHFSFDAWNTLISSNKNFANRRTQCISDHLKISYEQANLLYRQTKMFLDYSAEIAENCMTSQKCWQLLVKMSKIENIDVPVLQSEIEYEFSKNLPHVNEDIVFALRKIKLNTNISMGILSNTNFIKGDILRENIFNYWGVFNFEIFSDEILIPKPNKEIFETMYCKAKAIVDNPFFDKSNILHIGDNEICDGAASKYGMGFLHVESPKILAIKLNKLESANHA